MEFRPEEVGAGLPERGRTLDMAYRQGQKSYRTVYPTQTTADAGDGYLKPFQGRYVSKSGHICMNVRTRLNRGAASGYLRGWAVLLVALPLVPLPPVPVCDRPGFTGTTIKTSTPGLSVRCCVATGSSVG